MASTQAPMANHNKISETKSDEIIPVIYYQHPSRKHQSLIDNEKAEEEESDRELLQQLHEARQDAKAQRP